MTTATKTKSTSKYTPSMIGAMKAAEPLTLAKCVELAATAEFKAAGISARSIGAKARVEGIDYVKVERASKTGEPVADKAEIVAAIAAALGVEKIDSLAKADKAALRKVLGAVERLASEAGGFADE